MAIVSFWSQINKETGQTFSLVALATYMSIEHNYKTLLIDATFKDDTMKRCFWKEGEGQNKLKNELNKGKLDIASGTEGLLSAIASNKTTPEIIANYAKVVFKNRLDVLLGIETDDEKDYSKSLELYVDLIKAANKYYDLIIIDLPKTYKKEATREILKLSDVVVYTMNQNLKQIDYFNKNRSKIEELCEKKVMPLLNNVVGECKYNLKNVSSYIQEKNLTCTYYNCAFLEAMNESNTSKFFINNRKKIKIENQNYKFIQSIDETSKKIMAKFEEIKYGKIKEV